jgi:phage gp45-like
MMLLRLFQKLRNSPNTRPQSAQVETLAGELHNDATHLEPYGFTSAVPSNVDQGVAGFVNGQSDHVVLFGYFDLVNRPVLLEGESIVYAKTDAGISTIKLSKNGDIEVTPASGIMKLNGEFRATGDVKAGTISLQNHVHGGVVAGGSNTGAPQ